jgi:ParB-like chromosome segregation protein Spo0J
MPIIVRPKNNNFEILDGRNRVEAAKAVGKTEILAIIVDCPDDETATAITYDANINQRGLRDMKISEQARIVANYYYAHKKQGQRTDLQARVREGINELNAELDEIYKVSSGKKSISTFGIAGRKYEALDTREEVGKIYGFSGRSVARLVRINKLSQNLKNLLDVGEIGANAAIEISYIPADRQVFVEDALAAGGKLNVKKAAKLKKMATKVFNSPTMIINKENVERILFSDKKTKEAPEEPITQVNAEANSEPNAADSRDCPFPVKVNKAEPPPEFARKYKPIENIKEYLKTKFPNFFGKEREAYDEESKFIRSLINFFVRLKDVMCYRFPQFFEENDPLDETLRDIFDAAQSYYATLEDVLVPGMFVITPQN